MTLRRGRRRARERRALLEGGSEVEVRCHLRRTSSRGWGPWVEGVLQLPGVGAGAGEAAFLADDPAAAALVVGRTGRSGPVPVGPTQDVSRRPVRFKGEAFFGLDAEVLVVATDRYQSEIAVDPAEVDAVAGRLASFVGP